MSPDREPSGHDERCEAEYVSGAGAWTLCDCLVRRTPDTEQAVMFAPECWDERTQSPVDEQAESLRYAEPPSADDAVGASESARCNGLCFRASDVGVDVPGDPVAYPNLLCPEHWGESSPMTDDPRIPARACARWVSSYQDDDEVGHCGATATAEWFSSAGEWQPICAQHSRDLPDGRLRPLSGSDGVPDWYGNFCLSCNHPHPEGDCDPEEAL